MICRGEYYFTLSQRLQGVFVLDKLLKKKEIKQLETPRNEAEGVKNFTKEMGSALVTALIFIVYVIQAFVIPTGSMEKSLMVGDFLLGLKFMYGSPVVPGIPRMVDTYWKFPGVTDPQRGDVVIFKYPGRDSKDYIKRCVAVAGDSVEVRGKQLFVNGVELVPPPHSQWVRNGIMAEGITDFAPLYVPRAGDTIDITTAPLREFIYFKHLIHQENPYGEVTEEFTLFVDGKDLSDSIVTYTDGFSFKFSALDFPKLDRYSDWSIYNGYFKEINRIFQGDVQIRKQLFLDGVEIEEYVVERDNYFMMGDNRDNSSDSRFWGFVNRNFVKAKAFIIYFSLNREKNASGGEDVPWHLLHLKIRWNRLGMLIRRWDGHPEGVVSLEPEDNPRLNLAEELPEDAVESGDSPDSTAEVDSVVPEPADTTVEAVAVDSL